RLLLAHAVERSEELGVHRRHRGDHADRRSGHGAERGDLALLIGADFHHECLVLGGQPQERERQPPLVVEGGFRLQHSPARPEHRGDHLLRRGFAVGAGAGDDRNGEIAEDERPLGGAYEILDGEGRHRQLAARCKSWRATSRSSNGSTSAPMIWYVSCPLPAITTVSPERAQSSAAPIAARRSTSRTWRPSPPPRFTPTRISSMMAS